jgi:hypothetical protein
LQQGLLPVDQKYAMLMDSPAERPLLLKQDVNGPAQRTRLGTREDEMIMSIAA